MSPHSGATAGSVEGKAALDHEFLSELLTKLSIAEAIEAEALADLFSFGFSRTARGRAVLAALRLFLARRTVSHAHARSPYYRGIAAYSAELPARPDYEPDFSALPLIDRATVRNNLHSMIAEDVHLRSVVHTSGTTGEALEIYKSFEEVDFFSRFFRRLFAPAFATRRRPLSLSFPTPHHGTPIPFPSPALGLISGVTDDTLIRDALRVLRKEHRIAGHEGRVSVLSGMGFQVLFFTNFLLEQGVEPKEFGLRAINVAGGFVPSHWRRFLEEAWGTAVNDRYSLTETVGGATRCRCCGRFKPDPQIFIEVLDTDTDAPVTSGPGKLIITNLYPFAQMTPLIRYDSGDLVRVEACPNDGAPAFEFLGRRTNCLSVTEGGKRHWLLHSASLHETLATIPDLNVYEWFSNVRAVRDRSVGSLPIVSVRGAPRPGGGAEIAIRAELRYSPHTFPERVASLREQITNALRGCQHTVLGRHLDQGKATLEIEMLAPGQLDEYIIKI